MLCAAFSEHTAAKRHAESEAMRNKCSACYRFWTPHVILNSRVNLATALQRVDCMHGVLVQVSHACSPGPSMHVLTVRLLAACAVDVVLRACGSGGSCLVGRL